MCSRNRPLFPGGEAGSGPVVPRARECRGTPGRCPELWQDASQHTLYTLASPGTPQQVPGRDGRTAKTGAGCQEALPAGLRQQSLNYKKLNHLRLYQRQLILENLFLPTIYTEKLHEADLAYLLFTKNSVMDVKLAKHSVTIQIQIGIYTFLQWWKQKKKMESLGSLLSLVWSTQPSRVSPAW